jgi:SAM-dependent methyltransferase
MTDLPSRLGRNDERPDADFYAAPRLVTHIDAAAVAAVTDLYRAHFPEGGALLDLMSSWVSHLPPEIAYDRVAGLGMNAAELSANPRLTERVVQDLNESPALPWGDAEFDGAAICVSVQYLVRPVAVFREVARVLRPGAPLVVSFSNRCFPSKAVREWLARDTAGHAALVASYFDGSGGFDAPAVEAHLPRSGDPLVAVVARRRAA